MLIGCQGRREASCWPSSRIGVERPARGALSAWRSLKRRSRLELWSGAQWVAPPPVATAGGESRLVLAHYLDALARKPRAVLNAQVVRELPEG